MTGAWIAVASAEHVRRGREGGFMQVCHGKAAPLRRIRSGDCVIYYSPTKTFGGKDKLQAFTAIGHVREGDPYQVEMGENFRPFRKDVAWLEASDAPIELLLDKLAFTMGVKNWGYNFRFGLFPISDHDREIIGHAMKVEEHVK
ncbi:EVE domain-containing protein [Microvirga flavescens]|uniref:EVE domain-containing protein n=1 Tax=Microvirga flavescens TaxID=2249811 RepID=UPI000DD6E97A|nr:EVE domain-containing protein [Microvirga flavescens]